MPGQPPPDAVDDYAAAVLAVPGVARLTSGPFGDLQTYLPGRSVAGVRERSGRLEIAIVLRWGASAQVVAGLIRARLAALTDAEVDVMVADIDSALESQS